MAGKRTRGPGTQPTVRVLKALELIETMRWTQACKELQEIFGIARGTAVADLAEANRLLEVELAEKMPSYRAQRLRRLERTLDRADAAGDYRAVATLQREITRITGIAAPEKLEHSGAINVETHHDFEEMSEEQLAALAALDRRRS